MDDSFKDDLRLIEAGFPCHQVGAETQRERGASSALPPLYFLHVWWARRPLTPSRAAILASLLPADADTDLFLRDLGIERVQVNVNDVWWTIDDVKLKRLEKDQDGREWYRVDYWTLRWLEKENKQRQKMRKFLHQLQEDKLLLAGSKLLAYWEKEFSPIPEPFPKKEELLAVRRVSGKPAEFNALMELAKSAGKRVPNLYGYDRAYKQDPPMASEPITILDPTSGGGSIPFESLRLGNRAIANELNPVAAVILNATLDYPVRYGQELSLDILHFGQELLSRLDKQMEDFFDITQPLPDIEKRELEQHLQKHPNLIPHYSQEETTTYLFTRQVTCPHCGGEAPLLNTFWLSKKDGDQWGVRVIPDGKDRNGTVRFEFYRVKHGKGPNGEKPEFSTVDNAVGQCIHCQQAISAVEIKRQARGESRHGEWQDRLYCVAAVRYQPKLDKNGKIYRYKSGQKEGQIRTEKITYFRPPNERDVDALERAERRLQEKWPAWEREGLIPTERFPQGNDMRPVIYGMPRWCDMFTSRQLLGHLTLVEELNRLKPQILAELGEEKGKAVVTYLQFAIDKGVDYNSKQTRWITQRQSISGTFSRHDFSVKWTFGEMIFTGPNSGAAWGLSQVLDAYEGIAELAAPLHKTLDGSPPPVQIYNRTAAYLPDVTDNSVDLVCIDPPYYNNVQYAELSDFYYVWEKRTLSDLYPAIYSRRLTNKSDEAVANPARDGSSSEADETYERMMAEIFSESFRVLKKEGLLTIMFTHKTEEAWEALTRSLIEASWIITGAFPVESEFGYSQHIMDQASAKSSVFLSCRKRESHDRQPAVWTAFGGSGVQNQVREAVEEGLGEFQELNLNPVDEMVASYGRALRVLSQNWPVLDGDKEVSPIKAMNEASRVVAEHQVNRITEGRMRVEDLSPEAAMALTLFGIYGLAELSYDDALNLSRSLRIRLESAAGGYRIDGRMIGINAETRSTRRDSLEDEGYFAPLVRSGSKLRLALPSERHLKRIDDPQTEWDLLQGLILAYREGDIPVARAYLQEHAGDRERLILDLLKVWTTEMADEDLRKEGAEMLFGLEAS
jgi:adenine-specific DNA methylase